MFHLSTWEEIVFEVLSQVSVSSMTSAQRLIISFCTLLDEDVEQLRTSYLDFYGSDSSGWSDSSADNNELPPAKRTRESAAAASSSSAAREAESENDETEASSASGYGDADRGYISAKIRHLKKLGCDSRGKNHHLAIPANNMEELMYFLEKGTKRDKTIFIMGEFSLALREPAAGARRRNFVYRVFTAWSLSSDLFRNIFPEPPLSSVTSGVCWSWTNCSSSS